MSPPDWRIEGYVHNLYADFSLPGRQTAVLEIEFVVLDAQSAQLDVALTKSYRVLAALRDREPASVAHGLRNAAAQAFAAFDVDLREALPPVEGVAAAEESAE